jgi:hypothetical protein
METSGGWRGSTRPDPRLTANVLRECGLPPAAYVLRRQTFSWQLVKTGQMSRLIVGIGLAG